MTITLVVVLLAGLLVPLAIPPQEWWIHIAQFDATDELGRHRWDGFA